MTSLVSNFIINPVLRQARRFSSGFATEDPPLTPDLLQYQRTTRSVRYPGGDPIENAIMEGDEGRRIISAAIRGGGGSAAAAVEIADPNGLDPNPNPNPTPESTPPSSTQQPTRQSYGRHGSPPSSRGGETAADHDSTTINTATTDTDDTSASTDTTSRRMSITTLSPLVQVPATPRTDATTPRQAPAQARAQDTTTPSPRTTTPRVNGSTLPEDDGMGSLRRRIKAVQSMDVSQDLKAQLMHQLLIEGYTKSQLHGDLTATLKPGSPSSSHSAASTIPSSSSSLSSSSSSAEPPLGALHSLKFWQQQPPTDSSGATGPLHNLRLTAADLQPTYVPKKSTSEDDADDNDDEMLERLGGMRILVKEDDGGDATTGRLGCEHYRRNVKMQCATCERWYTCRFCHDAAEDHALPRKETKNMLCMLCGCAQRASDCCVGCGESAACYYCGVCKLWNDDPNKAIYHCGDCGLCRVGQGLGKDFFHCKKCMACISMTGGHKCIERSIDCDCPICGEYMFSSPRPVVFMQCGHSIHRTCFNAHMQTSYKCPLCNKSCVNMEYQFRNYDMAILTQPMPAEYRDARAVISCNDCSAKCQTAYHWLGLKCTVCNSYNTVQLQLLNMPGGLGGGGEVEAVEEESVADREARIRAVAAAAAVGAAGAVGVGGLPRFLLPAAAVLSRNASSGDVSGIAGNHGELGGAASGPVAVATAATPSGVMMAAATETDDDDDDDDDDGGGDTADEEEREVMEDLLDFWGRDRNDTGAPRQRNIGSGWQDLGRVGGLGGGGDIEDDDEEEEEEEGEESSSSDDDEEEEGEEGVCGEDDDDCDDDDDMLLLGHR